MKAFHVNEDEIKEQFDGVVAASEKINESISKVKKAEKCKGLAIDEYYARIERLSKLLKSYKELVEKDMEDFAATVDEWILKDQILAGRIKGESSSTSSPRTGTVSSPAKDNGATKKPVQADGNSASEVLKKGKNAS